VLGVTNVISGGFYSIVKSFSFKAVIYTTCENSLFFSSEISLSFAYGDNLTSFVDIDSEVA